MFASKTVVEHISRGAIGFGSVAAALVLAPLHPVIALGMLPIAVVALRGCPTCWTIGLLETIAARAVGRTPRATCRDGSCAAEASETTHP